MGYPIYYVPYTKHPILQNQKSLNPIGVLLHSTGANNPNLKRYVDYPSKFGVNQYGNHFNRPDADQTAHFYIGLDKNGSIAIAQVLPLDVACWGCGAGVKGSFNYNPYGFIQIEICEDLTDEQYCAVAESAAAWLCAELCKQYNWQSKQVISHKEAAIRGFASSHIDPEHWINMNKFRDRVQHNIPPKSDNTIYKIQAGAFANKKNAQEYLNQLQQAGFPAFIVSEVK